MDSDNSSKIKSYDNIADAFNVDANGVECPVSARFSEVYDNDGSSWVTMKVTASDRVTVIDLDSPEQVRQLHTIIGNYLKNRGTFRQLGDDEQQAAEPVAEYD